MTTKIQRKIYLLALTIVAALGGFLFGYDTAVISGTIQMVTEQFSLNVVSEGWFVSSALLGCILGVAFAGKLSDQFGRKKILILSAVLFTISAIGCAMTDNSLNLTLYRLTGGLGVGIASIISPMYISEISPPAIRGRLVTLYQFAITIGILIAYFSNASILAYSEQQHVLAAFWSDLFINEIWRGMFITEIIPAFLFFILLLFIPESPRWLSKQLKEIKHSQFLQKLQEKILQAERSKRLKIHSARKKLL